LNCRFCPSFAPHKSCGDPRVPLAAGRRSPPRQSPCLSGVVSRATSWGSCPGRGCWGRSYTATGVVNSGRPSGSSRSADSNPALFARQIRCGTLVGRRPEFPSTFPPPDAGPRRTGRNGWGRPVTAGTIGPCLRWSRPMRGARSGWEGTCGEPLVRPVKSPANAYPGSNPGPATSATTSADMVTVRRRPRNPPGRISLRCRSPRRFADADPGLPSRWAEHALDQPGRLGGGLGSWWM
jgi:hypothetical protein